MALVGIWYNNFFEAETNAILPYDQYMHRFAAYFQQGDMESNGKHVDRNGKPVDYQTGPDNLGRARHQRAACILPVNPPGNETDSLRFYSAGQSHNPLGEHHNMLLSNFFAQTEALMNGKTTEEVVAELKKAGKIRRRN